MPIKGLFNRDGNHEKNLIHGQNLEKLSLRMNTLEVHMQRLLKLEERLSLSSISIKQKKDSPKNIPGAADVESLVEKRLKAYHQQVQDLHFRMRKLEAVQKEEKDQSPEPRSFQREESESVLDPIVEKMGIFEILLNEMEKRYSLLYEAHLQLAERVGLLEKKGAPPPEDKQVVIKEINIDKFFLDKYELNNVIAQMGIKELSGALNIGATYGKGALPQEFTPAIQKDFEELMQEKEELKKQYTKSAEEDQDGDSGSESSESVSGEKEDDDTFPVIYTKIDIEEEE
ncbi:hypothetical protein [Peribacillus kribbensis]|uniref:hypothetical protein n=1 Tax=Peribacillus kribbensis TaxID=356658 RepID=UPI0003FC60BD|nr:hypothetical protein [Peribacillus kribbensis]